MKNVAIVIVVMLAVTGCDPLKDLDWDRTAKAQHLRIGNRVKVDGVAYGLPIYEFKKSPNPENISVKKNWGTELDFWVYPDNVVDRVDPNAPIATVIGTIYNPMHNETLTKLRDTYPDTITILENPHKKHRFEIIGRIHSFKRHITPDADDTKPDRSLTAVRIHVDSIRLIE